MNDYGKLLLMNCLNTKLNLLPQCRRKIIKITVVASDAGVNGPSFRITGWWDYYRTIGMSVKITLNTLRVTASTITDKGAYSLFRTVCFLQHVRFVLVGMRCGCRGR